MNVTKFRVEKCGVGNYKYYGTCYTYYDHLDIYWDSGEMDLDVIDLSYMGVRKVGK